MSSIQSRDVDVSVFDKPIIGAHNRSDRTQEDSKTSHEVQKRSCRVYDLPGHHYPASRDSDQDNTSPDVYVSGSDISMVEKSERRSTHFGNNVVKSLDPLITLADRLVPIWATHHAKPTKKARPLPPGVCHCAASSTGSHMYLPYTTLADEVEMMPKSPSMRQISGRKNPCQ
jgi:hypothetical protein